MEQAPDRIYQIAQLAVRTFEKGHLKVLYDFITKNKIECLLFIPATQLEIEDVACEITILVERDEKIRNS